MKTLTRKKVESFLQKAFGGFLGIFAIILLVLGIANLFCPNGILCGCSLILLNSLYFKVLIVFCCFVLAVYLVCGLYVAIVKKMSFGEYLYLYGYLLAILGLIVLFAAIVLNGKKVEQYYSDILIGLFSSLVASVFWAEYYNGKAKCETKAKIPEESVKENTQEVDIPEQHQMDSYDTIELNTNTSNIIVDKNMHRITITMK